MTANGVERPSRETVVFVAMTPSVWVSFVCSSRRRHTILVSDWSSDVCLPIYPYERIRELEVELEAENERLKDESESWQFKYETADLSAKRLGGKWKANEERIRVLEAERKDRKSVV